MFLLGLGFSNTQVRLFGSQILYMGLKFRRASLLQRTGFGNYQRNCSSESLESMGSSGGSLCHRKRRGSRRVL